MDMRRFLVLALMVCTTPFLGPFLGCTSKATSNHLQPDSGPALSRSSTGSFNDPRYQSLVKEVESQKKVSAFSDEPESTTEKIGSAVKKASASVTGALTLKPKVDKADDPVALDNMPDKINVDVYYQAGRLAESSGNIDMAAKQYKQALSEDKNHIPSLISLARLYDRQDKYSQAETLYRRAIAVDPDSAMAHNDLGLCLARHDQADESLAELRKAVSLEPKRKLYRNNLATVLVEMGRNDEAWKELSSVHPKAVAHYNLGYLLYQKGDQAEARQRFRLAIEADRSLSVAADMLAQLGDESPAASSLPAPADKVRFRVDDAVAQAPKASLGPVYRISPVAMVLSPKELRRTPPTQSQSESTAPETPAVKLLEPIPVDDDSVPPPVPESQIPGSQIPGSQAPPPDGSLMRLPSISTSENVVHDEEESDLPTPELLQEVAQHTK